MASDDVIVIEDTIATEDVIVIEDAIAIEDVIVIEDDDDEPEGILDVHPFPVSPVDKLGAVPEKLEQLERLISEDSGFGDRSVAGTSHFSNYLIEY